MEAPKNPERYTANEWLEDFAESSRQTARHQSASEDAAWLNFHFVTKYPDPDEREFRLKRFDAANLWLRQNIQSIQPVIGGNSDEKDLQITPEVLQMLYIVFGLDHGQWPIPNPPIEQMIHILRRCLAAE